MWRNDPRSLLLRAVLLDWLGQFLILVFIVLNPKLMGLASDGPPLDGQWVWLGFCLLLYPSLGWLFGSYTVLRWRSLSLPLVLQRLFYTGVATLMMVAVARWLVNPNDTVWLVYRRVQFVWLGGLTGWVLFIRFALRRGLLLPDPPKLLLLAADDEINDVLRAWNRISPRQQLEPVSCKQLENLLDSQDSNLLVALTPSVTTNKTSWPSLDRLQMEDPRYVRMMPLFIMFEQQQERFPPLYLLEGSMIYDDLPWTARLSVQTQLKRVADLLVAGGLLLLTWPFIALASLFVWLEDGGPVFYVQRRSGWLGRPFTVFKIRTMAVQSDDETPTWTQPGDRRVTKVGHWLRRVRLDELPQLINVLSGEMSLIGPRPERPELEDDLENHIPHYRKRHWMRPGLSGWAQVCAPYASSIEDSDLKLSYDLYYLKHFSTWLDLVILFRTIKTVLKAGGR